MSDLHGKAFKRSGAYELESIEPSLPNTGLHVNQNEAAADSPWCMHATLIHRRLILRHKLDLPYVAVISTQQYHSEAQVFKVSLKPAKLFVCLLSRKHLPAAAAMSFDDSENGYCPRPCANCVLQRDDLDVPEAACM